MPSFRTQDDRALAVTRGMRRVHDAVVEAYAFRVKAHQIDQAKLADKLGVDKAIVSRRLSGSSNMTARTLAETLWALGHELIVRAVPIEKFRSGNVVTAQTAEPSTRPVVPIVTTGTTLAVTTRSVTTAKSVNPPEIRVGQ